MRGRDDGLGIEQPRTKWKWVVFLLAVSGQWLLRQLYPEWEESGVGRFTKALGKLAQKNLPGALRDMVMEMGYPELAHFIEQAVAEEATDATARSTVYMATQTIQVSIQLTVKVTVSSTDPSSTDPSSTDPSSTDPSSTDRSSGHAPDEL